MIATERQARNDDLGCALGHDRTGRHRVADDTIVYLCVQKALVEPDARSTRTARLHRLPEALDGVRLAVTVLVLKRHQESTGGRLIVAVVNAAPRIDIQGAVRGDHHMPCMTYLVCKDRCAKSRRQLQAAVMTWTPIHRSWLALCES